MLSFIVLISFQNLVQNFHFLIFSELVNDQVPEGKRSRINIILNSTEEGLVGLSALFRVTQPEEAEMGFQLRQ